jgi:hypothetical protein
MLEQKKEERDYLKKHIYSLDLLEILKKWRLDVTFAVRYILQKKYQLTAEEQEITMKTVLQYQPHIRKEDLLKALQEYDSDDDSICDFF